MPIVIQKHVQRVVPKIICNAKCTENVKLRPHDWSNASDIGHLCDVAHRIALLHIANDQCQVSNVALEQS